MPSRHRRGPRLRDSWRARRTSRAPVIPTGMNDEMVVGVYDSRADAEAAREQMIRHGLRADLIRIEARPAHAETPPADDRGAAGFIARMFSGALIDDASVAQYDEALRNGRCVLTVRVGSDAHRKLATTTLARGSPRVYSLPNAPSGWNEASAGDPASIGGLDDDPARPGGLLADAEGLPARSDEMRLANTPRTSRNR
jgi:hypothetical protein